MYFNRLYNVNYVILRYSHVFGPGQDEDAIALFINKALKNEKISVHGDGSQCNDYLFVDDIVDATILSIKRGNNCILNIGSGKQTSVNQLIAEISNATKCGINYEYDRKTKNRRKTYMDIKLAKKVLGWSPKICLSEGLNKMVKAQSLGARAL